jgi:hypothetical protein
MDKEAIRWWLARDEECRTRATGMKTSRGRQDLLDVAKAYKDMVDTAESLLRFDRSKEEPLRWWLARAEECRSVAREMESSQGRQNLLDLARTYDDMADQFF